MRRTAGLILAGVVLVALAGCGGSARRGRESAADSSGRELVVYIHGKAVEYGTGRVVANPPPRPKTLEEEVLDETRRKSDVTIWTAIAGPEGMVVWVPVRRARIN